ncbi:hypothetical protein AN958_06132 [Leucoagaricus sp. SymC.cos]|nr:hypothetical protein AN958_06132 [Leucoagaricus sp. SymC.cos]
MSNNNPTGINGYGPKNYPPKEELSKELHQFAHERLEVEECLERLQNKFQLHIKKSRLHELNKNFNVLSVRKPPSADISVQEVLYEMEKDVAQTKGVGALGTFMAN